MAGDGVLWASLAVVGYGTWLLAGLTDFLLHRHEDLAHTSGVAESSLHLLQLLLVGAGVLLWLYLQPSQALLITWTLLAIAHAIVGFLDTRVAFPLRRIGPAEQHVHSVLDMAPWIAVACLWWAYGRQDVAAAIALRDPLPSPTRQLAVLLPAALLTCLPALFEFIHAWRVRAVRR